MKKALGILSFCAVLLMAATAFLFVYNLGTDLYGLPAGPASVVAGIAFAVVFVSAYIPDIWPQGAFLMAISAKAIKRNANPANIAGLAAAHYYAFDEDIATFPAALQVDMLAATTFASLVVIPVDDVFVMQANCFFHPVPSTPETGKLNSKMVGPVDSMAFENTFEISNPGNNDDISGFQAYTANKSLIFILRDLNGVNKVVGTQDYPARMQSGERDSGTKVADGNITKFGFRACATIPCPTYLGAIPTDPLEVVDGVLIK